MKSLENGNAAMNRPASERPAPKKKPELRLINSPEVKSDFSDDEIVDANQTPRAKQAAGMDAFRAMARNDKKRDREEAGYEQLPSDVLEDEPVELSSDDLEDVPETEADQALAEFANSPRIKESNEVARLMEQSKQNIAAIEARIARAKSATEKAKLEKELTQLESALELAKIDFEAKARAEQRSMEHAAQAHFAGERAHAEGAEAGMAEQMHREEAFENELEIDGEGRITDMKNVPAVSVGAFYRAMAPAMQKINQEITLASKTLTGRARDRRIAQLESEAQVWLRMEDEASLATERGESDEKGIVRNEFFIPVDVVIPEGFDKSEAETLSIESEEDLEGKIESLKAQDAELTELIGQASEILWNLEDTKQWEKVEQREAMSTMLKAAENLKQRRIEGIGRELEVLRKLDTPQNLDLRSQRLTTLMQQAENYTSHLQSLLKKMNKKSGDLDSSDIQKAIDKMEGQEIGYKNDLASWQKDPIRKEAMQARHEELAQDVHDLEGEYNQLKNAPELTFDMGKTAKEAISKADAETQEAKTEYWNAVVGLKDQLHEFLAQKAKNAEELAAILLERAGREEFDIDLSDLEPEVVEAVAKMDKAA